MNSHQATTNTYNCSSEFNDNYEYNEKINLNIDLDNLFSSPRYLVLKGERLLNGFASLLSSAQSFGLEEPLMPKPEPALARLLSSRVKFDSNPYSQHTCSFPSLSLRNSINDHLKEQKCNMNDLAAMNLAFPCFVDPSNVEMAPVAVIENFTSSFMTLIKSRLRTSLRALYGKSGLNSNEAILLMKLLTGRSSYSSPASLSTTVTSFRTLPMTENVDDPSVLYLPLVYEAVIDITVLGQLVTVKVSAPGTITGVINQEDGLLERVEVLFDTIALLQAMLKQARFVVRKAIARAAGIAYQMTSTSLKRGDSTKKTNPVPDEATSSYYPSKIKSEPSNSSISEYTMFSWLAGDKMLLGNDEHNLYATNTNDVSKDTEKPITQNPCYNNGACNSDNISEYKMFSWLAGDKMLLDHDEHNLYTTNDTKRNISYMSYNDDIPMKKRKVSFCL